MYHCDIITEIILTYFLHWFNFFREAIEPFVLSFYIWGILLFGGIVLPHRVGGSCCCQRQPCSPSWVFESISGLFRFFFKESFQGISKETCWKFLQWGSWQPVPLCYTSLSVEVNSIKWCQEALTEHLSVYSVSVFLLFPATSAEKLGKTSWHCQMLRGTNQKGMVSSVWRRKYCLRNLECFCGRALRNCRNKSHTADPTPGAYSWRRRAEIVPAALLACVEPGRAQVQHPVRGSWGCHCALLVCPHLVWQREQSQCPVWVVRGKSAVSWQDGSVLIPEEMGAKEAAVRDIPKQEALGWRLYRPNRWSWIATALCGRWGLRSLKIDTFPSVDMCKWWLCASEEISH